LQLQRICPKVTIGIARAMPLSKFRVLGRDGRRFAFAA